MTYVGKGQFGDILFTGTAQAKSRWQEIALYPVRSLEDLPAPVAGVITLPDATTWQILGTVDITPNRIALGTGVGLFGTVPGRSVLVTDNALPAVSPTAGVSGRAVQNLTISNASGPAMSFTGGVTTDLLIDTVVAEDCGGEALLVSGISALLLRSLLIDNCPDGVVVGGNNGFLRIEDVLCAVHPAGFTGINIQTGTNAFEVRIQGCTFNVNQPGDVGLQIDAGVVDRGLVDANIFTGVGPGAGVALAGATTPASPRWQFDANQGIRDSTVLADLRAQSDPATVIPIVAANEWASLSALTFSLVDSERFSFIAPDLLQYDGIDPANVTITAQCYAERAAGGSELIGITVQRSGVPAVGSTTASAYETLTELPNAVAQQFQTTLSLTNVQPGEQFRILVRNRGSDIDIESFGASLTISES